MLTLRSQLFSSVGRIMIDSLIALQERKLSSIGFYQRKPSKNTMISHLPLLFANGYPTCLDKITLKQIEKFVPFMIQCSLGDEHLDKYGPRPEWWPDDLPFSASVEKPSHMDEARWFALLKSMVCRCYTYHNCEYMLRFCTELSECSTSSYVFVESYEGTTSLYSRESGRLMVTFRNENRDYDKELNTRRSLLRKSSTQISPRKAPKYDIYLCDNCDEEFDSLHKVQEHEQSCTTQSTSTVPGAELPSEQQAPPEELSEESFLEYFDLHPSTSEPVEKGSVNDERKKRTSVPYMKAVNVDVSSPLGILLRKDSRSSGTFKPEKLESNFLGVRISPYPTRQAESSSGKSNPNPKREPSRSGNWPPMGHNLTAQQMEIIVEHMERFCKTTRFGRCRDQKTEDDPRGPLITYKPLPNKKTQEGEWVHEYCFNYRDWREKLLKIRAGGLDKRSRKLLAQCKGLEIRLERLSDSDIMQIKARLKVKIFRRGETFVRIPRLLPNTMYTYHTVNSKEIEVVACDPMIPLIDLCSESEDESRDVAEERNSHLPSPSFGNRSQYFYNENTSGSEDGEQTYCNNPRYSSSESSYSAYPDDSLQPSQVSGTEEEYIEDSSSVPHSMRYCTTSPPSPSPAPEFNREEDSLYYVDPQTYSRVAEEDGENTRTTSRFETLEYYKYMNSPIGGASSNFGTYYSSYSESPDLSNYSTYSVVHHRAAEFSAEGCKAVANEYLERTRRFLRESQVSVPPSPTPATPFDIHESAMTYTVTNGGSDSSQSCRMKFTSIPINKECSKVPSIAQDSSDDSQHSTNSAVYKTERGRRASKRQAVEPIEIILDSDDDTPDTKKPKLQDVTKQDTSNNDVIGKSVKQEKATQYHQRCLAKSRLPLAVRRLGLEDCREVHRGRHCVANKISQPPLLKSDYSSGKLDRDYNECQIKSEPIEGGKKFRKSGKIVTISLLDDEVELIGHKTVDKNGDEVKLVSSKRVDKDLFTTDSKELWIFPDHKSSGVKLNGSKNYSSDPSSGMGIQKWKANVNNTTNHSFLSLKLEPDSVKPSLQMIPSAFLPDGLKNGIKFNSWKCFNYSSPVNPEQTSKYLNAKQYSSSDSPAYDVPSCKLEEKSQIKVEVKCLIKRDKSPDLPKKSKQDPFASNYKKNNFISENKLFQSNGQHCFKRKLPESYVEPPKFPSRRKQSSARYLESSKCHNRCSRSSSTRTISCSRHLRSNSVLAPRQCK